MSKILTIETAENIKLLHRPAKPVKNPHATEIVFLLQEMKRIVTQIGVAGVAATQLGKPYSIYMIHVDKTKEPETYFNTRIINSSPKMLKETEACLSVPDKYGYVDRAESIIIEYQDMNLNKKRLSITHPFLARAHQHEISHNLGILYTDICEEIFDNNYMQQKFYEAKALESKLTQ